MQNTWIDKQITYDGTQLRSRWIQDQTGVEGDAIAAFIGPADVPIENMVDLEDVARNAPIFSKNMLHFIVEHFNCELPLAIARQRILTSIATDELNAEIGNYSIKRLGDDIYDGEYKLSVSIATFSPVSSLIHFALNIISDETPVPTKGLADYGIEPRSFADKITKRFCEEIKSMEKARHKVRWVK
ncbi:MAG: DUF366 family protein [Pseudomonadota bacterium]